MSIKLMKQRWLSEVHDVNTEGHEGRSPIDQKDGSIDEHLDISTSVVDMELVDDCTSATSEEDGRKNGDEELILMSETSRTEETSKREEERKAESKVTSREDEVDKPRAPPPYIVVDENVVLCDENLVKEAAVVRCLCEPTEEELSSGSGCDENCINRMLYTECGSRCPSGARCSNRRFHNKEYAKVEVFYAGVKGWGLRACETLEPGRFIIEYVGEVISAEEMRRRGRRYGRDPKHVHHYLMALKNGAVIDATVRGNISRFINHSCDPNCRSEKWTVDRRLRIGFFAIKRIAVGEELVFDYQLELYGRKAQRCFCGAPNCRGLIGGGESESDTEGQGQQQQDEMELEESESEEEPLIEEKKMVVTKNRKKAISRRRTKKTTSYKNTPNKEVNILCDAFLCAISKMLSRGAPRNRKHVKELVQLMIQVEQADQRCELLRCFDTASSDILRLFMEECGLRLLYIFLASDYPVDDQRTSLGLYVKTLDLLNLMPITTRNQVVDSHLIATLARLILKEGPIDAEVAKKVHDLVDAICPNMADSSASPSLITDVDLERLHYQMLHKASFLLLKWKHLREEFRIPRRERSNTPMSELDRNDDDDKMLRRSVIPEKKIEVLSFKNHRILVPRNSGNFAKRIIPKKKRSMTSPTCASESGAPTIRRSRFDIVGEDLQEGCFFGPGAPIFDGSMQGQACPPPPMLLPESMFSAGFTDFNGFPTIPIPFGWNSNSYANGYDPFGYPPFMPFYDQQPMQNAQNTSPSVAETLNILDAPSPPPEPKPNTITLGPFNIDNPTDEDIETLEKQLAMMKEKRAAIKKKEAEQEVNTVPPPPPPDPNNKKSKWIQATTEEGTVYYYHKETRETVWHLPEEGDEAADTTSDHNDPRAIFKALIAKHVAGILEPIRKTKFSSADDYKYVLRKLTHTVLEKESKRVGSADLKVTESVKEKARRYVTEYIERLGEGQYSRRNKQHNTY
ncbi:unnamed protein product [Anisakis simplex]|uniref:[histone H3]-lysine(36) N-trimethyltransferase n=1 Tax=Anisakis simplex TaxID=6269 RepID=A0A0M3JRC5_ANISI|nr:unnamed protein product [Anisakis simplex]